MQEDTPCDSAQALQGCAASQHSSFGPSKFEAYFGQCRRETFRPPTRGVARGRPAVPVVVVYPIDKSAKAQRARHHSPRQRKGSAYAKIVFSSETIR